MAWNNWYLNFQHQHFWSSKSLPSFSILITYTNLWRLCDNKCAPCDKMVVNIFSMSTWVNPSWDPENRKPPSMRDTPPFTIHLATEGIFVPIFLKETSCLGGFWGWKSCANLHFYPTNGLYLISSGANCICRIHENCAHIHQDVIKIFISSHTSMLQSKMTTSWWRKHIGAVIYIFLLLVEE